MAPAPAPVPRGKMVLSQLSIGCCENGVITYETQRDAFQPRDVDTILFGFHGKSCRLLSMSI